MQFYQLGYLFKVCLEKVYRKIPDRWLLIVPILVNTICIYISENKIYFNDLASMSGFVKIAVLAHTARSTRAILPKQESHLAGWLN